MVGNEKNKFLDEYRVGRVHVGAPEKYTTFFNHVLLWEIKKNAYKDTPQQYVHKQCQLRRLRTCVLKIVPFKGGHLI